MSVKVNNQVVRLFELKEMTVGDALLAANIPTRKLYGKPGAALSVEVNGQTIHIPGEHGKPAVIMLNGQKTNTKAIIKNKDNIELLEGKNGKEGSASVRDLIDDASVKMIYFQGVLHTVEPTVKVNGVTISLDTPLKERDKITVDTPQTVEQVLHAIRKEHYVAQLNPYTITINDKNHYIPDLSSKLLLNGNIVKLSYPVQDNDILEIGVASPPTLQQLADQLEKKLIERIILTFQGEAIELTRECAVVSIGKRS